MNIVITGGAGFIGTRLARRLLEVGSLAARDGTPTPISRITLADTVAPAGWDDPRIATLTGNIADAAFLERAIDVQTGVIFHLAAVVSAQAEADFDLGMRVNFDATRLLLERCRACGHRPRVVFTSSIAVFGGALPEMVREETALNPQSSYGAEKAMGELLVQDYSRRGFIDGRVARLPTICVRPGKPNRAASSFASGIIREPLAGHQAVCPVSREVRLWLSSPDKAVESLVALCNLPAGRLGKNRIINFPGLSVTVGEMADALARVAGPEVSGRILWQRDPVIEAIVASWPGRFDTQRAYSLGLSGDSNFEEMIRAYLARI